MAETQVRQPEGLKLAHRQALLAAKRDEVPVGAVIVSADGKVLARAYNLREHQHNPVAHAEVLAIQKAARKLKSWRLLDCTLYVTLEPCPMCLAACQQARLTRVVFGATDPKGGALSLGYRLHEDQRTNHRFKVEHLPHEASSQVLKDFFRVKRNELRSRSGYNKRGR